MDPYEWMEPGTRVLVSSSPDVDLAHECSQLPWNPTVHPIWQGKVGCVSRTEEEGDGVWVKFFEWDMSRPAGAKRLTETEVYFHLRALQPISKLHFVDGDRVAYGRQAKGRMQYSVATLKVLSGSYQEPVYTIRMTKSSVSEWSPSRFPHEMLLPIYLGRAKHFLLREKNASCENVDTSPARIVYGNLLRNPGKELIHSLRIWSADGGGLFRLAIQRHPEQVNEVVDGRTPLMVAVEESNWQAIVVLIAFSAHRDAVDERHFTLLHLAAMKGDVRVLEGLLSFLERDVNKTNLDGDTALHLAVRGHHAACVDRLLCVSSIQANIANNFGETVVHVVCAVPESRCSLTILGRILGNHRLNPNMANGNGWTPIHLAIMRGNPESVKTMLLSRPQLLNTNIPAPLVFAALHGKNKVVDVILALKQDCLVELQTLPDGKTSLHVAVEIWYGDVDDAVSRLACVQSLVTSGVPLNAIDKKGHTACHLLVKYMSANPKSLDRTVLANVLHCQKATMKLDEMAAKLRPHWQLACLCFLAARGCDLTAVDHFGQSPIDLCSDEKLKDTLELMVQNRLKCCLPMAVPTNEFDSSDVHMCTFNCEDSVADVLFIPCGHRVMCQTCAAVAPLRRCPMCYANISSAVDLAGRAVEMGSALRKKETENEMQKLADEAAKRAKEQAEIDNKKQIEVLREALERLEMETSCAICLDARPSIIFNCGHTSCSDCSEPLKICHICRETIKEKRPIYT